MNMSWTRPTWDRGAVITTLSCRSSASRTSSQPSRSPLEADILGFLLLSAFSRHPQIPGEECTYKNPLYSYKLPPEAKTSTFKGSSLPTARECSLRKAVGGRHP